MQSPHRTALLIVTGATTFIAKSLALSTKCAWLEFLEVCSTSEASLTVPIPRVTS